MRIDDAFARPGAIWSCPTDAEQLQPRPLAAKAAVPAYAPELNPAERVFEERRRVIEGRVYSTIEDKMALVERELRLLAASVEHVLHLTGWSWIQDVLAALAP